MSDNPSEKPRVLHSDDWKNLYTGLGVLGQDKRLGGFHVADMIAQSEAEETWQGSPTAARAIETIPNDALREGYEVCVENEKETSEELDAQLEELDTCEKLRDALLWQRAYGGGAILVGANDGQDIGEPLNLEAIRSIDYLTPLSPRELLYVSSYGDPRLPQYGEVARYRIVPVDVPPNPETMAGILSQLPIVHESRLIRFQGIRTSRRSIYHGPQPGWGLSILTRVLKVIRDFETAYQAVGLILQEFTVDALKLEGLAEAAASSPDVATSIPNRAKAFAMCKSVARMAVLDSKEELVRTSTPVAGMADLLDRMALQVAAAVGMPATLLMGQAPAGLNATGASDIRFYYDNVRGYQTNTVARGLRKLVRLMCLAKQGPTGGKIPDNWNVKFPALWQPTEVEQATARKTQADADVAYITAQVLTPEEVADSRFGGDEYSFETNLDTETRDMAAEAPESEPVEPEAEPATETGSKSTP